MNTIENWVFNVLIGKLVARLIVTLVAALSSAAVKPILAQFGLHVEIDQAQLTTGMIVTAHAVYEWVKAQRMANPASPAVQTDPTAPGGDKSAVKTVAAVNVPQ